MSASRLAAHLPVADLPPAVQRLRAVAQALGDLAERVVFIGGSVAPLLQEAPPFAPRATKDVDGVVMTASGTEFAALQAALRARGFREAVHHGSHAHRWIAPTPEQDAFDLVSAGTHHGAGEPDRCRGDRRCLDHHLRGRARGPTRECRRLPRDEVGRA